ncbi:hypothetical protein MHLNE_11180 [Moorella humiferrea]|uniref:DUF5615 family PIN-like protein n=1 Tax=Neomoorella humiferrea TaxID=676965 RepID=UPI0030D0DE11
MLRFKIDENLPIEIADLLREAGYEAETVWSEQIQGFSDIELLRYQNLIGYLWIVQTDRISIRGPER